MFRYFKPRINIVAQIHDEIDSAQDRLLGQANEILNKQTKTEEELGEMAKEIGFINIPIAKKHVAILTEKMGAKETADLIVYYKQNYPFQKFITESELHRICDKYSLIFAPISNYIKDVPEKNLNEIKNTSSLKETDGVKNKYTFRATDLYYRGALKFGHLKNHFEIDEDTLAKYLSTNLSANRWAILNKYLQDKFNYADCIVKDHVCEEIKLGGLFIAAPPSHFNLSGLNRKSKFAFLHINITEVKDPIVFRYVKGGIQVISKWGDEASDELVINEKNN